MGCKVKPPRARHGRDAAASLLCAFMLLMPLMLTALAALLLPEAPGMDVYQKSGTTLDASNASQGYIMVKHKADKKRLKLQISLDGESLTYDLNGEGEYEVFPLQLGNGKYRAQVFRQISGSRYSAVSSISFNAELADPKLPYLYPNQFVNYDADTLAVARANKLCAELGSDTAKANAVYADVVKTINYDYILARTVESGYLPDLDTVSQKKMGICFDVAAMIACMLRSQGVPTQLVIGFADKTYHAWNLVYLNDQWRRCDATSEICDIDVKQYTTERTY